MMEKIQRFGSAMLAPVLLFAFAGLAVGIGTVATLPNIVGDLANEDTFWYQAWTVWLDGAWTVFRQIELLFVLGLPIALAKTANARAVLEAGMVYLTFNYLVAGMLNFWGQGGSGFFQLDYNTSISLDNSDSYGTGLKIIAGIKTIDTGIFGAIIISAIVVWVHNRYFEKKLPDFLGIFQGTQFVYAICFFLMMPIAFIFAWLWPYAQHGIASMQGFFIASGALGVWIYTFLERILIPTGLHHFIYSPFMFGNAVTPNGIVKDWPTHISEFAKSDKPLRELFPGGGFALHGNSKIFAPLGISAAFYTTARREKRKEVLALLIPVTLTAMLIGITEPLEFTFLFVAPPLFAVHAVLAASMASIMYMLGLSGNMGGGLLDNFLFLNWVPLWQNHWPTYLMQIGVGLSFTVIYFLLFRFLILKFDFKTPGREAEGGETKLYSKAEYKAAKAAEKKGAASADDAGDADLYAPRAAGFLELLGGADNITTVNNCATRLRVSVADESLVDTSDAAFKDAGALGIVRKGKAFQVIVGMDVPQVRERFETMVNTKE